MNLINKVPLFLLLLILLSSFSFAEYCPTYANSLCINIQIYSISHSSGTMTAHIFANQTPPANNGVIYSGHTYNITFSYSSPIQYFYNGTNSYKAYTDNFTMYCWGGTNGNNLCTGTATIYFKNNLVCSNINFKATYTNPTQNAYCATYGYSGYVAIGGTNTGYGDDSDFRMLNSTNGAVNPSWTNQLVCLNTNITADSGYYWLNRDDQACYQCYPNGATSCVSNTTGNSQICINQVWQPYLSCVAGGYLTCGLNSSSQCPNQLSITEPSMIECTNQTNCSSNELCVNGFTVKNPLTCLTTIGTLYENIPGCETGTRYCMLNDGQPCTDGSQCASYSCQGKDATGIGTCTKVCSLNPSIDCGLTGTCIKATTNSESAQTVQDVSYCVLSQKATCTGNDQCGTGNCKPQCGHSFTTEYGNCLSPGYSCFCGTSSDCSSGESCTTAPTYSGPIYSGYLRPGISVFKTCEVGIADGQSCTSSSQCSSNNCQNGYCCGVGKVCCSLDSQCATGQICYNNVGWSSTGIYRTCGTKRGYQYYCLEDKECITQPCASNFCSGTDIPTYVTYTTDLPSGNVIGTTQVFNITVSYYSSSNNSLITSITGCKIYVDGQYISEPSCSSPIPLQITTIGSHTIEIIADALQYAQASTGTFIVYVYNTASNNATVGTRCTTNTECSTDRCASLQEYYYRSCYITADCVTGNCVGGSPSYWFSGIEYPGTLGTCSLRVSYGVCVANDSYPACDPSTQTYPGCTNSYQGLTCNPSTYTCSGATKPVGSICTQHSDCDPGLLCNPNDAGTVSYCCSASSTSTKCCSTTSECQANYVCDSNVLSGTYVCIQPQGGGVSSPCQTHNECDVVNGYGCMPGPNGYKICQPFAQFCNGGTVPCAFCVSNSSLTAEQCKNQNLTSTISCETSSSCVLQQNGQVTPNPSTTVAGSVNIETLFNQIVNLIFYTFIVAILFMIIALIVAGFTLAYGLIKR